MGIGEIGRQHGELVESNEAVGAVSGGPWRGPIKAAPLVLLLRLVQGGLVRFVRLSSSSKVQLLSLLDPPGFSNLAHPRS